MTPPRWFWPLLAACAVLLTAAASYALVVRAGVGRYIVGPSVNEAPLVLDTRTGRLCTLDGTTCLGGAKS